MFECDKKEDEIYLLNKKLNDKTNWKQYKNIIKIKKNISLLEKKLSNIRKVKNEIQDLKDLSLLYTEDDTYKISNEEIEEIELINKKINNSINDIEFHSLFNEKNDIDNAYLDIQSGAGGIDAQDWSSILLKMYSKWGIIKKYKVEILYKKNADIAGIKEATLKFSGEYAYGFLKRETGIHRLVRKSPFDISQKRHTSFSSIFVYPETKDEDEYKIEINASDLRIDTYRAGGAGGQHVNRTESAVRITHIPTNVSVQCQNERSQHQNKNQALKRLKLKLNGIYLLNKNNKKKSVEEKKMDITWGNQIRSYIFDDGYIKDLRTGVKVNNISSVMNGYLDDFMKIK